jgi:predicted short-subunit dehydrogenase-like oxidoreductase (DUF2520 family)
LTGAPDLFGSTAPFLILRGRFSEGRPYQEADTVKCQSSAGIEIGIIGAGRVGTALSLALAGAGFEIAGAMSRRRASVDRLIEFAGLDPSVRCESPREVFDRSDVLFISVGDDAIAEVAKQIADGLSSGHEDWSSDSWTSSNPKDARRTGQLEKNACRSDPSVQEVRRVDPFSAGKTPRVAAHLSGALGSSVLAPLRRLGASVASLHPVKSFSEDPRASADLTGTVATIEGDASALETLESLAATLGMKTVRIRSEFKPLYHAAACIASNYMVTLFALSLSLMESCGMEENIARAALSQLVRGTAQNLTDRPPGRALTGPIARGDVQTIRGHIEALRSLKNCSAESVYRMLGLETVDLAERNGRVRSDRAGKLRTALKEAGKA